MMLGTWRAWRMQLFPAAAPPGDGGPDALSGTWRAEAGGRVVVVVLAVEGRAVRGRLHTGADYCMDLAGELGAQGATGTATGPLGPARFEALVRNGSLALGLTAPSAGGGPEARMMLQLARAGDDAAFEPCPPDTDHRDAALAGSWRHSSLTGVGGQASADERRLDLDATGALAGSHVAAGRWRSHGGVVYHQQGPDASWEVLATVETRNGVTLLRTRDGRLHSRMPPTG